MFRSTSEPDLSTDILFWRGPFCPYRWGSSNHQAETWRFWSLTPVSAASFVGLYWGRWPCFLASALNCQNTIFFRIIQCFLSILNLSQTHFDVQWPCNDALPKYGCSKISFPFGPSYHLTKFGHGVFGHPAGCLISCAQKFSWVWPVSRQCIIIHANQVNWISVLVFFC